jgi:cell division septum initiation protein DivIVA
MSAYRVIDKLEAVVRGGLWMPFGWRAVNADRLLDLIEKLRGSLPDDTAKARRADTGAEATVRSAAAMEDAAAKTTEHELISQAHARANEIVEQAQRAARDIRRGADEYADQVLASLDHSLGKALAAVQKGRQALANPAPPNGKPAREATTT